MISPFAHLNTATLRAEGRRRWRRRITDLACFAALAVLALVVGHTLLTTALSFDQLLLDAAARGSM